MEFAQLGRHCFLESCHRLDWLPFQCDHCHQHFCLDHRSAASHSCTAVPPPAPPPSLTRHSYINPHRCTAPHCHAREALPNHCRNCGANFCLRHRFPTAHTCAAQLHPNVIRKQGQAQAQGAVAPQSSTILSPVSERGQAASDCATEARKEDKAERRRNTNIPGHSRLLQQPQKAN